MKVSPSIPLPFFSAILTVIFLLSTDTATHAQSNTAMEGPTLAVHPALPMVNTAVELVLIEPPDAAISGKLIITNADGVELVSEDVTATDKGVLLRWTPPKTGYYDIRFEPNDGEAIVLERVPVVWQRMYFPAWPWLRPAVAEQYPLLTSTVIVTDFKDLDAWNRHGSRTLGFVSQRRRTHIDLDKPEDQMIAELVDRWAEPLKLGADGIWLDELGSYADVESIRYVDLEMKALKTMRDEYPNAFLSGAVGGATLPEYGAGFKAADALLMAETYGEFHNAVHATHSVEKHFDRRIETMRNTDVFYQRGYADTSPEQANRHGGIMLLSFNHVIGMWEEPALPRMENYIRYIKKTAPEMPGIGFYGIGVSAPYLEKTGFYTAAEKLADKYYVRPVIDVRNLFFSNYEPRVGEALPIHVGVHNVGGMDADEVMLQLRAIGPDLQPIEIGEAIIEQIGTGFQVIKHEGKELEFVEINGNTYGLLPGRTQAAFLARHTLTINWTPPAPGYYTVIAEVRPSDDYTVLTGRAEAVIAVGLAPRELLR